MKVLIAALLTFLPGLCIKEISEELPLSPLAIGQKENIMRARWVQNYKKSPELPIVQQTLIASWLPWKYYIASTVQVSCGYVTQIFRCDKVGFVRSLDNPLLEREYSGLDEAIDGHKEAVTKFTKGGTIYDRT